MSVEKTSCTSFLSSQCLINMMPFWGEWMMQQQSTYSQVSIIWVLSGTKILKNLSFETTASLHFWTFVETSPIYRWTFNIAWYYLFTLYIFMFRIILTLLSTYFRHRLALKTLLHCNIQISISSCARSV